MYSPHWEVQAGWSCPQAENRMTSQISSPMSLLLIHSRWSFPLDKSFALLTYACQPLHMSSHPPAKSYSLFPAHPCFELLCTLLHCIWVWTFRNISSVFQIIFYFSLSSRVPVIPLLHVISRSYTFFIISVTDYNKEQAQEQDGSLCDSHLQGSPRFAGK